MIRGFVSVTPLFLVFLSACVSTSFSPVENFEVGSLPPVSPTAVSVLSSPPGDAFRELGTIDTYISGVFTLESATRKACERAATIGADAIVVNSGMLWAEPGGRLDIPSENKLVYVRYTAIRFVR